MEYHGTPRTLTIMEYRGISMEYMEQNDVETRAQHVPMVCQVTHVAPRDTTSLTEASRKCGHKVPSSSKGPSAHMEYTEYHGVA